jgi:hypothetical protein
MNPCEGRREEIGDCDKVETGDIVQSSREARVLALRGVTGEAMDLDVTGLRLCSAFTFTAPGDETKFDEERDFGLDEAEPCRLPRADLEIVLHSPTKPSGLAGSKSKANSSIPEDGKLYSLPLWPKLSNLTMLGFRPSPCDGHSGTEAM